MAPKDHDHERSPPVPAGSRLAARPAAGRRVGHRLRRPADRHDRLHRRRDAGRPATRSRSGRLTPATTRTTCAIGALVFGSRPTTSSSSSASCAARRRGGGRGARLQPRRHRAPAAGIAGIAGLALGIGRGAACRSRRPTPEIAQGAQRPRRRWLDPRCRRARRVPRDGPASSTPGSARCRPGSAGSRSRAASRSCSSSASCSPRTRTTSSGSSSRSGSCCSRVLRRRERHVPAGRPRPGRAAAV